MTISYDENQEMPDSLDADLVCDLMVESMTVIRNITEGRLGWCERTPVDRLAAVKAISSVLHNLHPRAPIDVVVSAYLQEEGWKQDVFDMLPQLGALMHIQIVARTGSAKPEQDEEAFTKRGE